MLKRRLSNIIAFEMRFVAHFSILTVLFFISVSVMGQGTLQGRVRATDGTAVPFATVGIIS